ncbi:pentatricopeptide repeat-containing protein At4g04370 isoform X2 [Juglans microcarpa x Juglans regia]|uniref:pentatricopeptide repeat-containing protein At4g04370 isoform X2 n=1 Tax=Juglans microcarpa x Juglans regia TaxID=2249226 RepID=UPI001B7ED04E|nr:pentatricopeptide repeat-containing protein At4g04370 isoform X2 [Juglans microcarpa x Juglans regia]
MSKLKPSLFNSLKPPPPPHPTTTKSFNAVINCLSSQGSHREVLLTYSSMLSTNTPPDAFTFPSLLKACTFLDLLSHGFSLHQRVIVNGYSSDAYIASSLINFYAKFGFTSTAHKVFDVMPERNVVPWTAVIGCYSRMGDVCTAFSMYNEMRGQGIQPTSVTLLTMLSGAPELTHLQCLHSCAVLYGFESDIALANSILNVYGKCGSVEDAKEFFEFMDSRDIVSWNSLISGYAQIGNIREVFHNLDRMRIEGMEPDQLTFGPLLSVTATQSNLKLGKMVHGKILRAGFYLDAHVETSLVVMYLKCGNIDIAFKIFEQIPSRDVVLWTAMISGLVQNECADEALKVFCQMLKSRVEPSTATIASALAACAQLGSFDLGTSVHGFILRQGMTLDIPAQNSLVTMYAKCGHLDQSCAVFDRMARRDLVSWNAIVAGYAQNGLVCKALILFGRMRTALQRPDSVTVVSLLQGCASIGALHEDTAQKCFDGMSQQDLVTWSTIIAGYGSHGKGETALRMYSEFIRTGIEPNHVIFLSVLSACSHNGLVHQGLSIFQSMTDDFGIAPNLEHRACIVDLLSRAGRVEEAYNYYKRLFPEPSVDVLGILLDACRANGKDEIGDIIARDVLMLRPVNAGNYVQLAHSYASMNRWDGVGEVWTQMRSLGLKKLPGWSFIELYGIITTFFSDHNSHPQSEDIVSILGTLSWEMRKMGTNDKTGQTHDIS